MCLHAQYPILLDIKLCVIKLKVSVAKKEKMESKIKEDRTAFVSEMSGTKVKNSSTTFFKKPNGSSNMEPKDKQNIRFSFDFTKYFEMLRE